MNPSIRKKRETQIKPTSPKTNLSSSSPKPKTGLIIPKSQAAFVTKLFKILELEEKHLISWSTTGERFLVFNPIEFSRLILPLHFKHNNWQSFVRQLNMYGFHKVNNSSSSGHAWEFRHPHFRKGRPDLISLIKRKSTRNSTTSITTPPTITPIPSTHIHPTTPIQSTPQIPTPQPQIPPILAVPPAPQILSIPAPIPISANQRRTIRYDPVRDPAAVAISSSPNTHDEQISNVLRMMFGLISGVVKDPSMNDKLEATRLAIIKLEESLNLGERIDQSSYQFHRECEDRNSFRFQDSNRDEEIEEDEGMEEVEEEVEEEELEETEETEIESDISRDSRSV